MCRTHFAFLVIPCCVMSYCWSCICIYEHPQKMKTSTYMIDEAVEPQRHLSVNNAPLWKIYTLYTQSSRNHTCVLFLRTTLNQSALPDEDNPLPSNRGRVNNACASDGAERDGGGGCVEERSDTGRSWNVVEVWHGLGQRRAAWRPVITATKRAKVTPGGPKLQTAARPIIVNGSVQQHNKNVCVQVDIYIYLYQYIKYVPQKSVTHVFLFCYWNLSAIECTSQSSRLKTGFVAAP